MLVLALVLALALLMRRLVVAALCPTLALVLALVPLAAGAVTPPPIDGCDTSTSGKWSGTLCALHCGPLAADTMAKSRSATRG